MSDKSIRILITDDQAIVRKGIRALLETESDFEVIGEADHTPFQSWSGFCHDL